MSSRQDKIRQVLSQYLHKDSITYVYSAQLLFEDPFLGVLITLDDQVYALATHRTHYFGLDSVTDGAELQRIDSLCGKRIRHFAAGENHIHALSESDGSVYVCGCTGNRTLTGTTRYDSDTMSVQIVRLGPARIKQIECSDALCVALSRDGKVRTWSKNRPLPIAVQGVLADRFIVKVSCTSSSVFCLSEDGEVYSFLPEDKRSPVPIPRCTKVSADHRITDISCGQEHILALTETGVVFAWGANRSGQGGTGNRQKLTIPTEIRFDPGIMAIMAEGDTSFAMNIRRVVYAWGSVNGQVVREPIQVDIAFPKPVVKAPSFDSIKCRGYQKLQFDYRRAFDNAATSNFILAVERRNIHVHSQILQIKSPHFRAKFANDWKETERAVIHDQSYEVYREFMRYLYSEDLEDLNLTTDNVLKVFSLSQTHDQEELAAFCVRFAVGDGTESMQQVVDSEAARRIPAEHLLEFMIHLGAIGYF